MQIGQSSYSIFKMGIDRGHYSIVSYTNIGIDLGTQICTATDLSVNLFTYEGFTFVSADGGNTWLNNNNIEYAVAPPIKLRKSADDKLYICYQSGDLATIKLNESTTLILSVDEPGHQYSSSTSNPSGFNVGEPMVDLHDTVQSFDYENYHFEAVAYGSKWEVSPAVTE